MSDIAALLDRLHDGVVQAVASGDVGVPRSIRFHVGGPGDEPPEPGRLLALGDAVFGCPRAREMRAGGAMLCEWAGGQVATVSAAPAPRPVVVLTVLGSGGALHFREVAP